MHIFLSHPNFTDMVSFPLDFPGSILYLGTKVIFLNQTLLGYSLSLIYITRLPLSELKNGSYATDTQNALLASRCI